MIAVNVNQSFVHERTKIFLFTHYTNYHKTNRARKRDNDPMTFIEGFKHLNSFELKCLLLRSSMRNIITLFNR